MFDKNIIINRIIIGPVDKEKALKTQPTTEHSSRKCPHGNALENHIYYYVAFTDKDGFPVGSHIWKCRIDGTESFG